MSSSSTLGGLEPPKSTHSSHHKCRRPKLFSRLVVEFILFDGGLRVAKFMIITFLEERLGDFTTRKVCNAVCCVSNLSHLLTFFHFHLASFIITDHSVYLPVLMFMDEVFTRSLSTLELQFPKNLSFFTYSLEKIFKDSRDEHKVLQPEN